MKNALIILVEQALTQLAKEKAWTLPPVAIAVQATEEASHGDFASNIALLLAKPLKQNPRTLAEAIIAHLPPASAIQKVEVAGPGFINFFLSSQSFEALLQRILTEKAHFGRSTIGEGRRVLVEFVSSNPTGPLHVGHGRHAAFGSIVANLLEAVGYQVSREYYVNDAGRQMDILAVSVLVRYLLLLGESIPFPDNAYQGDYVVQIAEAIFAAYEKRFLVASMALLENLPKDQCHGGDKEVYIDALIARAKALLGERFQEVLYISLDSILSDIKEDLQAFGVTYDRFFSERELVSSRVPERMIETLKTAGHTYEKDGALWFRSSAFGDEKDRVLLRANGAYTYFANDIAYHMSKFERGFDLAIDVFGADHHGYLARVRGAITALQIDPSRLVYLLTQFVALFRSGKPQSMSTRSGEFVTLRALREEVGNDAARFFYVMRKVNQSIDFDLDLAKSQSNDNPVYYVQYAYARICSLFKTCAARGLTHDVSLGLHALHCLSDAPLRQLLNQLARYPDIVLDAARHYEPQILTQYLRELAACFHGYYNAQAVLVSDEAARHARLTLILALRYVLENGFRLLGITLRESM